MLNYVNSVSCSTNENQNEFILTFRQVHPVITSDGQIKENAEDVVSEIVMNRDFAVALKAILDKTITIDAPAQ